MTPEQQQRLEELTQELNEKEVEFNKQFSYAISKYSDYLNTRAKITNLVNSTQTELSLKTEENA